jgi:hypothetical protein
VLNNHPIKGEQLEQLHRHESRGARGRGDGRADRCAPRQCRSAGRAFRPSGQGRRPERDRQESHRWLKKLEPSPLATKDRIAYIDAANYEQHPGTTEGLRPDHRGHRREDGVEGRSLSQDRSVHRADAIIASNTSGLSINRLSEGLPANLRPNFCGIHFFNPPRYMHLVELIATRDDRCRPARQA